MIRLDGERVFRYDGGTSSCAPFTGAAPPRTVGRWRERRSRRGCNVGSVRVGSLRHGHDDRRPTRGRAHPPEGGDRSARGGVRAAGVVRPSAGGGRGGGVARAPGGGRRGPPGGGGGRPGGGARGG